MATAIESVLAERQRQVDMGRTSANDDRHVNCELAWAAAVYAAPDDIYLIPPDGEPVPAWPWDPDWIRRTNRRRDLVKAGALILAEIDRLDREAARVLRGVDQETAWSALTQACRDKGTFNPREKPDAG